MLSTLIPTPVEVTLTPTTLPPVVVSDLTAIVAVVDPSYVKSAIPFPSVKSGKFVVPVNEPLNEPVKLLIPIVPKEVEMAAVSTPPSLILIVLAVPPL